jgi:GNAT superfamily N-acetyltransferase
MDNIIIINPDVDQHGAQKENIFVALDKDGTYLGSIYIYPFYAYDLEPEHPHNLYLYLHSEPGKEMSEQVKDQLLEKVLQRAAEIKKEEKQTKTRVYTGFLPHQKEGMDYFLQRGFIHDEGMHVLERLSREVIPPMEMPRGVTVQSWKMVTEVEQQQFIETHRQIFPRHPYSHERLSELKSLPGWNNFTAFDEEDIAGNVMMHINPDDTAVGWIEDLFVQRDYRRRGIGRFLVHTALTYFHNMGIHRVQLEHWSANKPALQLYRAFGFSQIDETEIAVGRYV